MREKLNYREQLEIITRKIEERFPESMGMLTTEQVAEFLGCNVKTVLNNIHRRNGLQAKNIGIGKRTAYRIPIASLAHWCVS